MKNATASKEGYETEWILLSIDGNTTYDFVLTPSAGNTLYVGGSGPGNYSSIQDAINDASDGDIVFVYDDSSPYYENVIIAKGINLTGENKDTTIIDGGGNGDIINITTHHVDIDGFTIRNGKTGIQLWYSSKYNRISNCNIYNNSCGIYADYCLRDFDDSGSITFFDFAIWVFYFPPHENNILNCNIYNNFNEGISFSFSGGNTILNNTLSNSEYGIEFGSSSNNTISTNIILNNTEGIFLQELELVVGDPPMVIELGPSSNNTISENIISDNHYGMCCISSNNNSVYTNNFVNNDYHAYDDCSNIWNYGYPLGGNYWDGFDEPVEGAYDDYHGENQDYEGGDGIVDKGPPTGGLNPYNISGGSNNKDWYPLMKPYPAIPPEISDVTMITSDPLDTEPGFGWEKFTCTVTDDVAVDEVKLVLTYNTTTEYIPMDKDGDPVYYMWDWDDGNYSEWLGPYDSGETCTAVHVWDEKGTYEIKVKAKDVHGEESDWSEPFSISMPKDRSFFFNLLDILEQLFPRLFSYLG